MHDVVFDFLEGGGLEKQRLGLGTPDLAAASLLVADEHQYRPAGVRPRRHRRDGQSKATRHHRASFEHPTFLMKPLHAANMAAGLTMRKAQTAALTGL